ncbi:MAG: glycosyltransferase [Candidatus Thorarchaeota archaeon]
MTTIEVIGQASSYIALSFGFIFFIFACKYYLAILLALFGGKTNTISKKQGAKKPWNTAQQPKDEPFISIQLPFYNEKNVARRIIDACSKLDYSNYEILIADDSRDETIEILQEIGRQKNNPPIKIVHRNDRVGFKGGALQKATQFMDPRTKYVVVFDADFMPPPDILRRFLWYFEGENRSLKGENGHRFGDQIQGYYNSKNGGNVMEQVDNWYERRRVGVVQGYQLHHLNKNENWITRGIRAEFSGGYMIERTAEEFFGAMKMITGSVFMIRADVLKKLGWTHSITEDWDLTLRMYMDGYKVLYTPLIQAPAEIPTTIRALARQRMRWAEGHTYAVKKHFWGIMKSQKITFREKLEFLYFAPYYLQSFFFLIGTLFWFIAESLNQHPDFWTATFGWCLLLSNMFALPLMSLSGLYLEKTARADFTGIFSFITLSYVITPFQAYAAVKGLLEKDEGGWVRTLKTGSITDRVLQIELRKLFKWILPKSNDNNQPAEKKVKSGGRNMALAILVLMSSVIVWMSSSALSIHDVSGISTALTLERASTPLTVNGFSTQNILTHPDYMNLGVTATDSVTVQNGGWMNAWSFTLYGPLQEDYTMRGPLRLTLFIESSVNCTAKFKVSLYELDESGRLKHKSTKQFNDIVVSTDPSGPIILDYYLSGNKRFDENSTIHVKISLKNSQTATRCNEVTYGLNYDSLDCHSRIEFPGIVMPENLLPAGLLGIVLVYAYRRMGYN